MDDTLDTDLKKIEAKLADLTPKQMPENMLSRMEQAMASWETHLPVEEKIVPFNPAPSKQRNNLFIWSSAAAIILMAVIASVFMTSGSNYSPTVAENKNSSSIPPVIENSLALTKTTPELSRNITHASNEGITYAGKNDQPFKVLRIEYTEKITTHDKDGKPITINKPCVEHVLIPVPVH